MQSPIVRANAKSKGQKSLELDEAQEALNTAYWT
jgi:hypothetical protein